MILRVRRFFLKLLRSPTVFSVIEDKLVNAYLHVHVAKDLWEALESKLGATDVGSEMYIIQQFHDYKVVENHPVLEQAHEIICIIKELELLKCDLPGKFVAGCIISKLPNSWRSFATNHHNIPCNIDNKRGGT